MDCFAKQHEGNVIVRMSKLQILTTKFKFLKMFENKIISKFYARLCEIYNEAFCLDDHFSENR